ncbi:TPA: hypothetical protein OZT48_004773 [Escherichia coli]|nr:hypothetical protein [Escherichia coli]HCX4848529.1 hypothetical protein [Escherichia coli]
MTTITKERLLTIRQWRETYGPGSNVVLPAEEAEELARIALTSLEAEPVAYIFKHPAGKLFWALTDESNKEQADVIPVYAAAPASVVPDNASEPLAYAYKELTPEIMRNHLAVFERYGIAPNDSSTTIQALRIALDGTERSDAMLHGAEPVSQTYKLNELAGNYPDIPDSSVPAPGKGVTGERIRIKPHVYRELVNRLHDTAVKCAGTQQLRERISRVLGDVITPDHHKQAEKSGLERCHLEAALNIKPGHTLGIIDALLVHKMARALLPLVADKHEAGHANES